MTLRCAPTPRAHSLAPRTLLSVHSLPSLRALCNNAACLVRRFLKFEGPPSGQNRYVVNNYTVTQPQGVRHELPPQMCLLSFATWRLLETCSAFDFFAVDQ